jgi:hypothetical protein
MDVVEHFKNDYHIYQIGYEGQQLLNGCHKLTLETREILAAVNFSQKRLLIDSFSQHASVAFDLMSQPDTYTFWAGALIVVSLWSMTAALLIYQITDIVNKYKSNNK